MVSSYNNNVHNIIQITLILHIQLDMLFLYNVNIYMKFLISRYLLMFTVYKYFKSIHSLAVAKTIRTIITRWTFWVFV